MARNQHVVPRDEGWAVMSEGSDRASKILGSKREARDYAREVARNQGVDVIVHDRKGMIMDRFSPREEKADTHAEEHVVPHGDGWAVRGANSSGTHGTYSSKYRAVREALRIADENDSRLVVHNRHGEITGAWAPPHSTGVLSAVMKL